MSVYVDASALVPMFLLDPFNARVRAFRSTRPPLIVSTLAKAEFATTVDVRLRAGKLDLTSARRVLAEDVEQAIVWLSRLDLTLRAPDAIHIAAAARLGATLLTFDEGMAVAAKSIGVTVEAA